MSVINEDKEYLVGIAKELGFENKSFLVTGATGMIGQILVSVLSEITDEKNIIVVSSSIEKANQIFGNKRYAKIALEELDEINYRVDYIFHLASPTNSKYLKEKPVETITFMVNSTKKILDFALSHNSKVLYASSMEAYGEIYDEESRSEEQLGYVSLTNTRNSYPESKRLCELLCYSYCKENALPAYIARLSQTFGAGTKKDDSRVFGYFARCAINKEDIVLNTKGDTVGNYCYIADTLSAFFYILKNGEAGETYNIVGDNCRSTIYNLAKLVTSDIAFNSIKILIQLNCVDNYPKPTMLNMSNNKLKSIGWAPKFGLKDMFVRMIESWKE